MCRQQQDNGKAQGVAQLSNLASAAQSSADAAQSSSDASAGQTASFAAQQPAATFPGKEGPPQQSDIIDLRATPAAEFPFGDGGRRLLREARRVR